MLFLKNAETSAKVHVNPIRREWNHGDVIAQKVDNAMVCWDTFAVEQLGWNVQNGMLALESEVQFGCSVSDNYVSLRFKNQTFDKETIVRAGARATGIFLKGK